MGPAFAALSARLAVQAALHCEEAAAYRATVHEALIGALEDAATRGLFDDLTVAVYVTAADAPTRATLIRASAPRLNHRGEADPLLASLG